MLAPGKREEKEIFSELLSQGGFVTSLGLNNASGIPMVSKKEIKTEARKIIKSPEGNLTTISSVDYEEPHVQPVRQNLLDLMADTLVFDMPDEDFVQELMSNSKLRRIPRQLFNRKFEKSK
jgi:hypothetical protein